MEVTRSAYYRYINTENNDIDADVLLIVELKVLHKKSNQSYGSRRMAKALSDHGYCIGRFKARRLMRQNGMTCKQRRRYTVTTQSNHELATANNHLGRNFTVEKPNCKWVADITYLWTVEGWLYLAAVLDLFSRRVIGWAMADNMRSNLVESAFAMAKRRRQPDVGFLHHSDRGVQYASQQYQALLKESGAIVSMSRKGNCWDNAVMERFFGTLKSECTDGKSYFTRAEARTDVANFVEVFYNAQRLHSTLNYMSPVAYEKLYETSIKQASVQRNGE
ncbi:MAG: Integrase-like protein [candidate division TM6 bacterium GW2011_GWF2_37_49]|nr:MAG: Integrase-like protein [candidate division TM6 bacterium GW2011_GWF2_37_49]